MKIPRAMTETEWVFDTDGAWRATVDDVPRGDRAADWYDVAVPQIATAGKGRAATPCVVVARVNVARAVAATGRAKRLLDALHDLRPTGRKYAEFRTAPPLQDDKL